jgi:hypothetical protein
MKSGIALPEILTHQLRPWTGRRAAFRCHPEEVSGNWDSQLMLSDEIAQVKGHSNWVCVTLVWHVKTRWTYWSRLQESQENVAMNAWKFWKIFQISYPSTT